VGQEGGKKKMRSSDHKEQKEANERTIQTEGAFSFSACTAWRSLSGLTAKTEVGARAKK
jgi:hypothetical protein